MTRAGSSLRRGLESIRYAKAERPLRTYRVHIPAHIDVKAIREKQGLTQQAFAARYGFSINTLRHWEQGMVLPTPRSGHMTRPSGVGFRTTLRALLTAPICTAMS
jgi:putative transcriptional regulator